MTRTQAKKERAAQRMTAVKKQRNKGVKLTIQQLRQMAPTSDSDLRSFFEDANSGRLRIHGHPTVIKGTESVAVITSTSGFLGKRFQVNKFAGNGKRELVATTVSHAGAISQVSQMN